MPEITSDSSRMLTENVSIALRSGASSRMISRKSPPIGAGPTTRITSPGLQNSSVSNASIDGAPPRHVAHVDVVLDLGRHVGGGQQPALVAHLHRHRARADAVENLLGQAFRHHAARRRIEHQRRGVRGGQAIVEPVEPEIGDRRHVNENFRHHHEQDGEEQQLAGQTDAHIARSAASWRGASLQQHRSLARFPVPISPQPKIRSQAMMRRTQGLVKLGVKKSMAARLPISDSVG